MRPAGLAAFALRDEAKSRVYSYEREVAILPEDFEAQLRANADAWVFWEAQPPGYRRLTAFWILSAKRDDTRRRRLEELIAESAAGRRVRELQSPTPKGPGRGQPAR
jgi:uncharacterized protein YdeI (YjbR/CyaY-like superfamily)